MKKNTELSKSSKILLLLIGISIIISLGAIIINAFDNNSNPPDSYSSQDLGTSYEAKGPNSPF